jgi:hypothetical protein
MKSYNQQTGDLPVSLPKVPFIDPNTGQMHIWWQNMFLHIVQNILKLQGDILRDNGIPSLPGVSNAALMDTIAAFQTVPPSYVSRETLVAEVEGRLSPPPVIAFDAQARDMAEQALSMVNPPKPFFGPAGATVLGTDTYGSLIPAPLADSEIWVGNGSSLPAAVAVSGDATLADTGALTLKTVNSNVGTYGDSTHVAQVAVNGKGLVTAAGNVAITFPSSVPPGTYSGTFSGSISGTADLVTGAVTGSCSGTCSITLP